MKRKMLQVGLICGAALFVSGAAAVNSQSPVLAQPQTAAVKKAPISPKLKKTVNRVLSARRHPEPALAEKTASHTQKQGSLRIFKEGNNAKVTYNEKTHTLTIEHGEILNQILPNGQGNGMVLPEGVSSDEIKTIDIGKGVSTPINSEYLFAFFSNLTAINGMENADTGNTEKMGFMFASDVNLDKMNTSRFNTGSAREMKSMFWNCGFKNLDLSSFETDKVKDFDEMFYCDSNLSSIKFSPKFNTRSGQSMERMFSATGLQQLDLSSFNTAKTEDMSGMFLNDPELKALDISSFDTGRVKNMEDMFGNEAFGFDMNLQPLDLGAKTRLNKTSNVEKIADPWFSRQSDNAVIKANLGDGQSHPGAWYQHEYPNPLPPITTSWITIKYENQFGKELAPEKSYSGATGSSYYFHPIAIKGYTFNPYVSSKPYGFFGEAKSTLIFVYDENDQIATGKIQYKDQNGNILSGMDQTIDQNITKNGNKVTLDVPRGYHLGNNGSLVVNNQVTVKNGDNQVTVNVVKNSSPTPPKPDNNHGQDGVVKHSKVYAVRAINLYRHANLTGKIKHYKKVKRLKRPRFYVKKISVTKHGTPRYYVKQLNVKRYGWITGNMKFVQNNYYQPRNKSIKFEILNPRGLNVYRTLTLHGKRYHLRYHQIIRARKVKKDGLQTRFYLKKGQYVSARKNFVIYR